MTEPKPLTCGKLRALATREGTFANSHVVIRMTDGTLLRVVSDEVYKPAEPNPETGKDRLAGVPTLILTVERVHP